MNRYFRYGMTLDTGAAAPDHPSDLYVGQLDELRLFSVARTAPQICADAGRAPCP